MPDFLRWFLIRLGAGIGTFAVGGLVVNYLPIVASVLTATCLLTILGVIVVGLITGN
jgi:hypothetical protein